MQRYTNTLILLVVVAVVAAAGLYLTEYHQPAQLEHIENMEELSRLQEAQVTQLLVEAERSSDRADEAVRRWEARYRYIPAEMTTPDIVEYLEEMTSRGFEAFNIRLTDIKRTEEISHYTFSVDGTAYYSNLYDFVWQIENEPDFYRIRDLTMARTIVYDEGSSSRRRKDMVRFSLTLDAYFAGLTGLSAAREDLTPIPAEYLPDRELAHNSFYPLVRAKETTDNARGLVDVERARLVSIAGSRAIFEDGNTQHVVYEGSDVYRGQIVKIDPINVFVRVVLTKDGNTETLDIQMEDSSPTYRQAEGNVRLVPVETKDGNERR